MAIRRKWWKLAISVLALIAFAQLAVGVLVRTRRVHDYLIARLERAFGRQVEVGQFDAQVFPSVRLDANGITVGEDPAFGHEYFLRAEKLTAGLRWRGLVGGHFEFGTLTLSRPSLILVRSSEGRWNLEDWLPPAKSAVGAGTRIYGPPAATGAANRLQKIEFDDGRVNFKTGEDKRPFAFLAVTGSVEQVSPGRWQLQLEAQPWRSGVALQSAGTLRVRGDIAGTSARLQPAELEVHWTEASLADLLRLLRGQDYGVRGSFSLDATGHSATAAETTNARGTGAGDAALRKESAADWIFALEARAASIHRWDLTERLDNPRLTIKLAGRGNIAARTLDVAEAALTTPASNLHGMFHVAGAIPSLDLNSAGLQARDVLAWWRAFEPGVDEGLAAEQFFSGSASIRGWPPAVERLALSSEGGMIRIPGVAEPIWIGVVRGGSVRGKLTMEPVRVQIGGERSAVLSSAKRRGLTSAGGPLHDAGDLSASEDFSSHTGGVVIEAEVEHVAAVLRAAAAIGRPLQHGWDIDGRALGSMQWDWNRPRGQRWSGKVVLSKTHLAVAGLNQQLQVDNAACVWDHGTRSVLLGAVEGFGTSWSGTLRENPSLNDNTPPHWNFSLHGGALDATEIDRWVGPRARPGWLRSLVNSLGGAANDGASPAAGGELNAAGSPAASGLLRQVDADGDLTLDALTIEAVRLENVRVNGRLHGLQLDAGEISAQWAGGKVRGKLSAKFSPRPFYDMTVQLDAVSLARLPAIANSSDPLSGVASGSVHLTTEGVGRAELLQNLAGQGKVSLHNVEFRGWDVGASVADGAARSGISRWDSGAGTFALLHRRLQLDALRLDGGSGSMLVRGTVDFAWQADLSIKPADAARPAGGASVATHALKVSGPLYAPQASVDTAVARAPAGASEP